MNIYNYQTEKYLREIMYSTLGYVNKGGFWRKPKPPKKHHKKGQVQCAKCLEYFDNEFIITGNNKKQYCIECEKTVILWNSRN
jgi:hypothetical protein